MTIAETVGPNVIISTLCEGMKNSKMAPQQKTAIQIFLHLIEDFGAFSLDVQSIFNYIKSDKGLCNTHADVKNEATKVICTLHRQLGDVVKNLITQCGFNDLLNKAIMSELDNAPFNPALAAKYTSGDASPSGASNSANAAFLSSAGNSNKNGVSGVPVMGGMGLELSAMDLEPECSPLLTALADCKDKTSWKNRQQAVIDIMALLKRKQRILNNAAARDLAAGLRERLTETNLNLKRRVIECIGQFALALGEDAAQFVSLAGDMVTKSITDSNSKVVASLFESLNQWTTAGSSSSSSLATAGASNPVLTPLFPLIVPAFTTTKARGSLLTWLDSSIPQADSRALHHLINPLLDCMTDKVKSVRDKSVQLLVQIAQRIGRGEVEEEVQRRKPSDAKAMTATLQPLLASIPSRIALAPANRSTRQPSSSSSSSIATGQTTSAPTLTSEEAQKEKEREARMQALANRPGVRVLGKRAAGGVTAAFKRQAVSSIPKPVPVASRRSDRVGVAMGMGIGGMSPFAYQQQQLQQSQSQSQQQQQEGEGETVSGRMEEGDEGDELNKPAFVLLEPPAEPPTYQATSLCTCLQGTPEMLLTQKEQQQFEDIPFPSTTSSSSSSSWLIPPAIAIQVTNGLIMDLSSFLFTLTSSSSSSASSVLGAKNRAITACAKICQILDNTSCTLEGEGVTSSIDPVALRKTLERQSNTLLSLFVQLLSVIDYQDTALSLNLLNAIASIVIHTDCHGYFHRITVAGLIEAILRSIVPSVMLTIKGTEHSLRSVFHTLLVTVVDSLPLPQLLIGVAMVTASLANWLAEDSPATQTVVLALRRVLIRLFSRINRETLDDSLKQQCIQSMREVLPNSMPEVLQREFDTCLQLLEPLSRATLSAYGEVLRSAHMMLNSSQPVSENLTSSTLLKNQMEMFRQRYRANRVEEKQSTTPSVSTADVILTTTTTTTNPTNKDVNTMETKQGEQTSSKEKEYEERMRSIRERMESRRQMNA